ncbi:MAG: lytic transglycosylase domain-containing protein [Nitrospirae bacterium]|nr:lytic transglycosylase domain-containing protein [Nitrospirota bacterium]
MLKAAMVICSLFLAVADVSADIYKYVDENGVVCFTDAPYGKKTQHVSSDRISDGISDRKAEKTAQPAAVVFPKDYSRYIQKAASRYALEPELIKAVIKTESNGNHRAVSRKGAKGLMQLMPSTARDMNVSNPFDPEENIEGGARYLKYLLERFNGNMTLALAAYNSGPGTVEKYGNVPPIDETRQYVKRVFNLYNGRKSYTFADASAAPREKIAPIYKVVLEDGTILFTNATLEKNNKTRL